MGPGKAEKEKRTEARPVSLQKKGMARCVYQFTSQGLAAHSYSLKCQIRLLQTLSS